MAVVNNRIGWELLNVSSSNSSDEDSKKKPEFPSHGKISTEKTERKSRPKYVSKENGRDSSLSSVSSQTAAVPQKTRKKRKKKPKSSENARDSSVANLSSETLTSSNKKPEKNKSAENARDSSVASVSSQTSTSSKKNSAENARDSSVASVSSQTSTSSKKNSAVEKKSPTNTNDLEIAKRLTCINFPLEANYDFRLVCSQCLVKEKEGPNAFCLKNVCPRCPMDRIAIKKKSKSNWLLVRNRPPFNGVYRICFDFQSCAPCKVNPCTFAHGEGESIMWTHEQNTRFKLDTFIKELRKNNIVTSQRLAEVKSNAAYIPGLSTPISSNPSESHRPGTTPNVNKSTKGLSPATIPTQDGYTKIHVIKSQPIVQPSLEPVPAKDVTNFPALHGRSDTNSIDTSPQLYTVDNPDFTTVKYEHSYTDSVVAPPKKVPSNPSLKPVSVESWPFTKDENPLQKTHDFQMFCSECFPRNFQRPTLHTNCLKNILAFAEKGTRNWLQVRERKKLNFFAGSYVLCKSLGGDPSLCKFGHENCSFAHNTIEMLLWNADKHENFDLTGFIYSQSTDEYRIFHFVRKYGTTFSYVCGACFKSTNLISCKSKKGNVCDSLQAHDWSSNKTLFYSTEKKLINKLLSTTYLSGVCFNRNCRPTCSRAHSTIEREVWILLRAADITEEKFVDVLNRYSGFFMVENDSQQDVVRTPCPYKLCLLCKKCSLNGQNIMHKKCGHSKISSGVIYMTTPGEKRINKLPNKIPKNYKFTICQSLKNNKCTYQGLCTFAHSQDEIDVWQWMCFNKIKNLEEVISHQEKQSTEVVKGAASIVQELLHPAAKELPVPHYCQFCSMSCRNQMEWENHCTTTEHNKNVSHDQEQQWNYREPPWNYQNEKNLRLCEKHEQGRCLYSNSLDMHNLCPNAHGIKELEEWKKRFEWRALKMDLAKKPQIMSYIVQLQEMCLNSPKPFYMMSESILDVQLEMNGEKKVLSTKKKFSHTWTITVTSSKKKLQKVSLLHDKDRLYFTLKTNGDKSNFQVLDAHHCKREGELNHWRVTVNFNGNMYGTFSQRVIFDFGDKPLLFQDLAVDVGTYDELQQLETIRDENKFLLWTPENQEIIFLPQTTHLMNKYKRPADIKDVLSHDVITTGLNQHNYVQKMHKLLFLEEFACQQKMARYNLCGDMIVSETIANETVFSSRPGTLFGELSLSDELSDDTDIGRLILTSCTSVYIALPMLSSKVYEVEIFKGDNVNFNGQCRNRIYLVLTTSCIHDLGLIQGVYEDVELQFQLNRQSFYLMHFALDNIDSIDIVFPDPVKNVFSLKTKPTKCSSQLLNKEQLIAVKYIVGQRENFVCPFILNGAYGTGKTETLAQATMQLLDTQQNAKILICTQCNSSADLFILKHLDEYAKKQKNKNMLLRVYYSRRFVTSVPYEVRKYTLMSPSQDQFRKAEKSDFANVRVVICTLENCHSLIRLQLKGMFTHIFIDEAAQEFEAKVLLPLSLATKDTCVVLSGDHHQMGIKIHSTVARQQGLGISIMQRLFKHYANNPHQTLNADSPLHTLLVHNYRSVKEISQFISKCFYGIATNQREQKTPPSVSGLKPLQFYAVSGLESHNHNSPSFFNAKEIVQVVDCVVSMASNWPKELGPFNPKSICIVSSYKDQVHLIRLSLRKHQMRLGQVVVEQVGNVPGKEFDVVIISTVRTSKCLDISREKLANYCEETEEVDFFVNKKLLNTAMTRAKYSVIVVGDPVALCAYGKCSTIWRIFISHCSKLCSVKPPEITYDVVRLEVSRLLSARERSIHGLGDTNHCVSPNPIQQVPIQDSLCYKTKPDIRSVDPVSKPESSNYVSPNPIYQVSSNNVSPNPTYQVPISKTKSSNDVGPNPTYQVSSNYVCPNPMYQLSSNNVSPNPTYQVPISKTKSSNDVGPNPTYQVSSNYVGPNPTYQVSSNYVGPNPTYQVYSNYVSPNSTYQVTSNCVNPNPTYQVSSNYVSSNPTYQVSSNYVGPNPTYQVSSNYVGSNLTCQVSSNYVSPNPSYQVYSNCVSPNPIYQVPIENRLFSPKPDIHSVDTISKLASPKVLPEVQLAKTLLHNPVPEIDPIDRIAKNIVSSKTSSNPDPLYTNRSQADLLHSKSLKTDPLDSYPKDSSASKMLNPDIIKLGWERPYPLCYPKSRIDSLFNSSEDKYCSESPRTNFSFPCVYVFDSPTENPLIGLSFYKVDEHFVIGIHWPDLQSYIRNKNFDDIGALETVLALGPKHRLPNVPELYFTLDHAVGAVSCLIKVDIQGKVSDCSFHQTFIKPEKIIPIEELENHLQRNIEKQELNFPNYLQKLANMWCKLRLGNEGLYIKNLFVDHPKSDKLLTEICVQAHIQIVRYLSKLFPETTPTAWQSFENGPRLDQWKKEHVSDALNSVLLLQPYLQGKICRCETFCKCLLDYIKQEDLKSTIPKTLEINSDTWQLIVNSVDENQFEDTQDIILSPFYHNRIAVALKKLSHLTETKFGYSNDVTSDYSLNFDPQVYFCKPSISFLDLLVQQMLVAAIHKLPNPVTLEVFQKVTKKLTETIAAKPLKQKDAFFKKLRKDFPNQTIETKATVVSVDNSMVEIMLPQIAFWSHSVSFAILGSSSTSSDTCTLQFTQIDANVQTYSSVHGAGTPSKITEPAININILNWQQMLSSLRKQNFSYMKNYVHTAKSSEVLKELNDPDTLIGTENSFFIDVHPYLNFQASVKIVEDPEGHCSPQLQALHLNPNVSLCLLHRTDPLKYFLPESSMNLSEYQHSLLTEVYRCVIGQHQSIILRDVTLFPENQFWTFSIPGIILQDHGICLEPDNDADADFVFPLLHNMICVCFALMAENSKSTRIFHGYICETHSSGSNVKVILSVTDDTNHTLIELQNQNCDVEIHCWTSEYRSMADSILNLGTANPLARNILSRQLKPVKYSAEIFSVFEDNEFAVIASDNSHLNLTHLIHWFEYYASILIIRGTSTKSPILICTPTQHELDIIVDCLQTENLLSQINVVRVADVCDESKPSCTSSSKIFLHEKLCSFNTQLTEEMNAFAEIYDQSLCQDDFKQQGTTEILSQADIILCTTLTTRRSVFRSVSSLIKQMIIFNAHLCPEVEAMIPISYLSIERLGLFSTSEPSSDTSIANRLLQSCPNTKLIFK